MDFSTVKEVRIPEGNVTKITCGGAVIWSMGRLPSGYREVEWLETDGNSYFVSDFTINALDKFSVYYKYSSPSGYNYMFGANDDTALENTLGVSSPRFLHRYDQIVYNSGSNAVARPAMIHDSAFHTVELHCSHSKSYEMYRDGELFSSTSFMNAKCFRKFGVFCNNYNGAPQSYKATSGSKISELRFVDDTTGEDVFNPVPCYRLSDGVMGMYDTVAGKFYTNEGTGSFAKGSDVL